MSKTRVLVVEDDQLVAIDICTRLEALGFYDVAGRATTGNEAIEIAAQLKPDLILMDIVLKGKMDGIEAAGTIRSRYDIPVVYLTAYTDEEFLKRAKITVPFGYILKPFNARELHTTIEMALYRHRADAEREKLISELKEALAQVKTLRGCLPICATCKKIRDDKGYWTRIEQYIMDHTDADFTHGICPDCAKKFMDDKS
ncbi:MAG: response regulator [Deltaproteobacteria bacterium]|nr:response regulator [Deltaproteobacteria bacterium]